MPPSPEAAIEEFTETVITVPFRLVPLLFIWRINSEAFLHEIRELVLGEGATIGTVKMGHEVRGLINISS